MNGYRYLKNVATLRLSPERCNGCSRCAEVCPHDVFAIRDRRAFIADLDACMECGACMRNCPAGAIGVDAGVGCAAGLINEWLQDRNVPGTSGGCCS
jgi:NAD-dependent dihydropyrimidine dehydrogenase PreA subunit